MGVFESKSFGIGWTRTWRSENRYLRKEKVFPFFLIIRNIGFVHCNFSACGVNWILRCKKIEVLSKILTHLTLQWLARYLRSVYVSKSMLLSDANQGPSACFKVRDRERPTPLAVIEFNHQLYGIAVCLWNILWTARVIYLLHGRLRLYYQFRPIRCDRI